MRKSIFAIDASPNAYIGYTSGRLWNGWATPYFTFEEAQKLQAEFSEGANSPMLYDVMKDEFRLKYEDDDEPYIWEGEDIQTVDGIKHLYGIGAYSHIWDELDDNIKRSLAQQIHDFLEDYDTYEYRDTVGDEDEFIDNILVDFMHLATFVKAYEVMNNDAYGSDEIYTKLTELLNI
jgi:hypothetical protein